MSTGSSRDWVFPRKDFGRWQRLTGDNGRTPGYAAYMDRIVAIQADQERQGVHVERVAFRVADMESTLAAANLPNTPENRATIIAKWPTEKRLPEWHFDFGIYATRQ